MGPSTNAAGRRSAPAPAATAGPAPRSAPIAATAAALGLVLAFRALYLARFGQDPCWMNYNFLLDAKAMRFGYAAEFYGMPLIRGLLFAARSAGASAAVALGSIYVVGHVLLALGIFGLARSLLRATPRSFAALAVGVAILPAFSTDAGYRNVSCTLAAGLFAALAALLLSPRAARPSALRLASAFAVAAAAATCRPDSALSVGALALALAVLGRRLGSGRAGAIAAGAGLAAGLLAVRLYDRVAPNAGLSANVWAFYTFYEASPLLWRLWTFLHDPAAVATEYSRYVHTAQLFGGFAENGGSILRALAHHPGSGALWLILKPVDFVATALLPDAFTPLAIAPLFLAARRLRREGWRTALQPWLPLLCAFAAPLAFLLVWSQGHAPYLLIVSPLLLLAALFGLEPWIATAPARRLRGAGWALCAAAALGIFFFGQTSSRSSAPALRAAALWLEERCAASGCLVNALPSPIDGQAWADLQAAAPMPLKDKRSEAFVLRGYPASYLEGVRWDRRMAIARERGWRGPVLYVRAAARSIEVFSDEFDPEHRLEGAPDLSGATPIATFRDGPDAVDIFDVSGAASARDR